MCYYTRTCPQKRGGMLPSGQVHLVGCNHTGVVELFASWVKVRFSPTRQVLPHLPGFPRSGGLGDFETLLKGRASVPSRQI